MLPVVDAVAVDRRIDLPDACDQRVADLALTDVPVYHSKHLMESLTGRVELEHLSETSYGTLSPPDNYMIPKSIIDRLAAAVALVILAPRSEEHTSELQSLMRISYAVFCLNKKKKKKIQTKQ